MPEILKLLPRTNCGECGPPTCLAFAVQVAAGKRRLDACPYVAPEHRELFADLPDIDDQPLAGTAEEIAERARQLAELKARFAEVDLAARAERLGAATTGDGIAVHCLGRVFELDRRGELRSHCHVNPWVHLPLLMYVIRGAERPLTGEWVTMADLPETREWARFFIHRCDRVLHRTADADPDLFLDVLELFGARPLDRGGDPQGPFSDEAMVLHPLPRVPLLISYWRAEGEFESKLTVFFDRSAGTNLGPEALFQLGTGLGEMFRRIAARHGVGGAR